MSQQPESYEQGWPARDFDGPARDYLLTEARQRVQEQLAHIGAQDVKTVALFTASALVFTASGILGDVRLAFNSVVLLTMTTFAASLFAWVLLGVAYWTRQVGVGVDLNVLTTNYPTASERVLRDVALEALVEAFRLNQSTISAKAKWIRRAFFAVAVQFLLLFASVVANAAIEERQTPPVEPIPAEGEESGAARFDGQWQRPSLLGVGSRLTG